MTKKILRVGDPHVMVTNLEESRKLMDFVIKTALEHKVDRIEFLGDLFHTHSVVRAEVLNFWDEIFTKLGEKQISTIVLVGNHDQIGDKERENVHALKPFDKYPYISIIDCPVIKGPYCYIPYMANHEAFIAATREMHTNGANIVICHQTFQGSTYENGFYAEDGIKLDDIPQVQVISGHIHKHQQIGKCDYPGTAKWDKATDAGQDKGIWIYNHNELGLVVDKQFFSTKNLVTPIFEMTLREGEEEFEIPEGARVALELIGQSAWITKMKKKYKGKASIRGNPSDRRTTAVDQSKMLNINDYILANFQPIAGVSKEDIVSYIRSF